MEDYARIGLKEWGAVIQALVSGRQLVLLREGALERPSPGVRDPRRFVLYPIYDGQDPDGLVDEARRWVGPRPRFNDDVIGVPIQAYAVVTQTFELNERWRLDAVQPYHIWSRDEVERRYAAAQVAGVPLTAMALRVFCLRERTRIADDPAYAKADDWIHLAPPLRVAGSRPALGDGPYLQQIQALRRALA
jgi:hypothetical protein